MYTIQNVNVSIPAKVNIFPNLYCLKISYFIRNWSSNVILEVNTEDYEDVFSNLDDFSDISYDQTNFPIDWYFPIIDECEDHRWLLFENELHSISDVCNIIKNTLFCEFHAEIFLQHPLVIKVI